MMLSKHKAFHRSQDILSQIKLMYGMDFTDEPNMSPGAEPSVRAQELCTRLPPESTARKLIGIYFNTLGRVLPIIDKATFEQRYEAFVAEPYSDVLWLLQLMMVCASGFLYDTKSIDFESNIRVRQHHAKYLLRCVEFVIFNDRVTRKPSIVLLETLLLMNAAKNILTEVDGPNGACGILGMVSKMAFSLGLHQDPAYFENISPIQAGRRRQLWAAIRFMDFDYSSQMGHPICIVDENLSLHSPPSTSENRSFGSHYRSPLPLEDLFFAGLTDLTRLCAQSYHLSISSPPNLTFGAIERQTDRLLIKLRNVKSTLSQADTNISAWPAAESDMNMLIRLYALLYDTITYRTIISLCLPFIGDNIEACPRAISRLIGATNLVLSNYDDFHKSCSKPDPGWLHFGQMFLKTDICRAIFCFC